jgi:hypothetical protein
MNVWDWSTPLGLGAFILAIATTLFVLSWTIKTLASISSDTDRRKR